MESAVTTGRPRLVAPDRNRDRKPRSGLPHRDPGRERANGSCLERGLEHRHADFLALLDAERTELVAEDAVASAEAQVFTGAVAVYKSLGGIRP